MIAEDRPRVSPGMWRRICAISLLALVAAGWLGNALEGRIGRLGLVSLAAMIDVALLAFIVSIDDYIITSFVAGPGYTTLPIYIFSTVRNVVTPEINAVSSLLMLASIGFVSLSLLMGFRRSGQ